MSLVQFWKLCVWLQFVPFISFHGHFNSNCKNIIAYFIAWTWTTLVVTLSISKLLSNKLRKNPKSSQRWATTFGWNVNRTLAQLFCQFIRFWHFTTFGDFVNYFYNTWPYVAMWSTHSKLKLAFKRSSQIEKNK